ncbi:glycosyl hydrolase [Solirubrobacter taibaiensis]|nr:glycosyl hydrolase [Solirubrobacter taibaiensis]
MKGRRLAAVLVLAACGAAAPSAHADVTYWRGLNPVTALTSDTFKAPPDTDRPWVRWNWPPAAVTIPQLENELEQIASAGVRGVEIGQGGNPTNEQLTAILKKANALGITVGLKYAGGAPITGTWENTNDYTRKTLNNSRTLVNGGETFTGALPGTGTVVAVQAFKCVAATCPATGVREIDRASLIDLTSQLTGTNTDGFFDGSTAGTLNWTAPAGGQWIVVTFRAAALQNAPELLSTQGTDALIAGYEAMWTDEIKALLKQNRSDLFVDSHVTDPWGTATELWNSNIETEFAQRAGYALRPDLAALFYADFAYSDKTDDRVRNDFFQVRNDLFIQNRVTRFQAWANTRGLALRLQNEDPVVGGAEPPYQDQIDVALNQDRPEFESLSGADQIDIYRPMASANHWNGNPWYSTECCAVSGANYLETLQDVQVRMNKEFAAGITKLVYHIYPTDYASTSSYPGYSNFGVTSFSGSWGPRNPNWTADGPTVNTWMARNQQVLTQGKADMDVAVYLHSFEWPNLTNVNTDGSYYGNKQWDDTGLERAGYTWDYLNPTMLKSPEAKVSGGVLAADGPSYGALLVNSSINTPSHPVKTAMPIPVAEKLLALAKDGLKVVVVGAVPNRVEGKVGSDAQLRAIIAELLAQPTVSQVGTEAEVPAKLAALGVRPDAAPAAASGLVSVHRADAATDYYFLYNQGADVIDTVTSRNNVFEDPATCRTTGTIVSRCVGAGAVFDQSVTLKGSGVPFLLDTDSGEITPIAQYTVGAGTVTVRVKLARDESTVIALARAGRFGAAPAKHVVSTTADSAAVVGGTNIVLRDTQPGTYTATLSDGTTTTATIRSVPAPIDLTGAAWQLAAEDWKPANPLGTLGAAGSAVTKDVVTVALTGGLKPWPDIPELAGASGVGTYTTTVTLPAAVPAATLSLGQAVDTVKVTVNGQDVAVDQISGVAEVGPALKAGANTLVVRVATTLNNRLATLFPAVVTRGHTQNYGLIGPVVLTPSGQAPVYGQTDTPGTVGGTVPATLALSVAPASFGAFTPGVLRDYTANTTAIVTSTAGDAMLTVSGLGNMTNGAFSLPESLRVELSKASWTGPVSNDSVGVAFKQLIKANDPLRTGTYSKTVTFTLSTTNP